MAPPEDRLGRKFTDVIPSAVTEEVLRAIHRAKTFGRESHYAVKHPVTGKVWRATVLVPRRDLIKVTVHDLPRKLVG